MFFKINIFLPVGINHTDMHTWHYTSVNYCFFVFKYITYYMIFYAYNDGKNVVWIDNLKKMISSPPGNFNWLQNTFFVQYVFSYIYTI